VLLAIDVGNTNTVLGVFESEKLVHSWRTKTDARETADGNAIQQQPTKDPRRRAWVWESYQYWMPAYVALWARISNMRSRYRQANGMSPYVFLLDTVTGEFRRKVDYTGTVASATGTSMTPNTPSYTSDLFKGFEVLFTSGAAAGRRSLITGNVTNGLISFPALGATPAGGDAFVISYWVDDWMRVRVLDANRSLPDSGIVKYATTKMSFVVDDASWNAIG